MVVLRSQPLEVCPLQRIDQIVGQPSGAARVTPGGAVEPPLVEAGEDQPGVPRLAGRTKLPHDAGGLDPSPDPFRNELRGAVVNRPAAEVHPAITEPMSNTRWSIRYLFTTANRPSRTLAHRNAGS